LPTCRLQQRTVRLRGRASPTRRMAFRTEVPPWTPFPRPLRFRLRAQSPKNNRLLLRTTHRTHPSPSRLSHTDGLLLSPPRHQARQQGLPPLLARRLSPKPTIPLSPFSFSVNRLLRNFFHSLSRLPRQQPHNHAWKQCPPLHREVRQLRNHLGLATFFRRPLRLRLLLHRLISTPPSHTSPSSPSLLHLYPPRLLPLPTQIPNPFQNHPTSASHHKDDKSIAQTPPRAPTPLPAPFSSILHPSSASNSSQTTSQTVNPSPKSPHSISSLSSNTHSNTSSLMSIPCLASTYTILRLLVPDINIINNIYLALSLVCIICSGLCLCISCLVIIISSLSLVLLIGYFSTAEIHAYSSNLCQSLII
jgi:hypothetical protein